MKKITLIAFLALAGLSQATGWHRVSVVVPDPQSLQKLLDSGLNIYDCVPRLGTTDVVIGPGEESKLLAGGFRYRYVRQLNGILPTREEIGPAVDDYRLRYFTMDEILAFFEGLRAADPNYITRQQIGVTRLNEPLWAYRIARPLQGGVNPVNNIIDIGCQHAREWVTTSAMMHLGKMSVEALKDRAPRPTPFLPNQALWIVPVTNPDGYRYTWSTNRLWRKNRRNNGNGSFGVDLNRNFATGWGGQGSSGQSSSETYRGPSAFSEPESQAVRNLANSLSRVGAMIDFHSFSQLVLWPWGYTETPPAGAAWLNQYGQEMRTAMSAFGANYSQGQTSTTLYIASGVSNDWFYEQRNIPSYAIELRDTGQYGFELPPDQILPTQDDAWAGLNALLKRVPR